MGFQKKLPKIIAYRDYKKFDNAKFRDDVNNFAFDQFDISNFKETIFNIFEIMKRLRLRDNFLSTKSQEDRFKYNTSFL